MTAARWRGWRSWQGGGALAVAAVALAVGLLAQRTDPSDDDELRHDRRAVAHRRGDDHASIQITAPRLDLAKAAAGDATATLTIAITPDAQYVDGERVDDEALARRFAAAHEADPATRVIIQADQQVGHGQVVAVMEAAKAAGLNHLALATATPP